MVPGAKGDTIKDASSLLYAALFALQNQSQAQGRCTELGPALWLPWSFGLTEPA